MRFSAEFLLATAVCAFLFVAPGTARADTLGSVTDASGRAPATYVVDEPQDALRLWRDQGQKGRTLLLVSEEIPLAAVDEALCGDLASDIAEGRWDAILARGYKTAAYYPVNRATYLFAANRAGMVSRVYWVPPTRESLGAEPLWRVRGNFRAMGATDAELDALVQSEDSISGTVGGIPVHICNLRDIPPIDGEVVLAIDLSFFATAYRDEVYTPLLPLVTSFMHTLAGSGVRVSDAVISCSTSASVVPLDLRFIAGYLRTFFAEPASLSDGPPATWQLRADGIYNRTFFQPEAELQAFQAAVDIDPKDASLRYDLAISYYAMKNIDRMKEELDTAVSLDRGYYPAYIEYGRYLAARGLTEAGEDFLDEAFRINPDDPDVLEGINDVKRAAGKYEEALKAQKALIALGFDGAKPYYGLAEDYSSLGEYEAAIPAYEKAIEMLPVLDSRLRPQALLGLAQAYEATGEIEKSLNAYRDAIDATLDGHSRQSIGNRYEKLRRKWEPFMRGGD